jgi:hypothetical protein
VRRVRQGSGARDKKTRRLTRKGWQDERAAIGSVSPPKEVAVPLVHACAAPDCTTLTMGELCLQHEREAREVATAAVLAAMAALPEQESREHRDLYLVSSTS